MKLKVFLEEDTLVGIREIVILMSQLANEIGEILTHLNMFIENSTLYFLFLDF